MNERQAADHIADQCAAADGIDPDRWRSVLYGWEDRALAAHSAQAQLQAASVPDVMDDYREGIQQIRAVLATQENPNG